MNTKQIAGPLFLFSLLIATACTGPVEVDLVVHNARIYTMDEAGTIHEAMAVKEGRIVETGPEHQILNKYSASEKRDVQKATIYPGFIDAHCHFLGYGLVHRQLHLVGTESFAEVLDHLASYVAGDSARWIIGRGWDQNDWEIKTYPTNDTLNVLYPGRFVVLKRVDGHAMLVSDAVLQQAGITAATKVEGGQVVIRDGKPTGILIDEAMTLVEEIIPEPSQAMKTEALMQAQKDCLEVGLTTVDDAGLDVDEVHLIRSLHETGQLKMRVYAMYSAHPDLLNCLEGQALKDQVSHNLDAYAIKTERLTAKSVKVYADGALGSRGAHLHAPYADDSTTSGLTITPYDSLVRWAKACSKNGFQMNVHSIGDQANHLVLEAMGSVLQGTNDKRWRIEHAQVLRPEDIEKFGTYNIIPSVQPTHATSDMYWAEDRLGSGRIQYAYAYQTLMEQNGLLPLGTDFPVEGISPIATFYAAVVRKDPSGYPEGGFRTEDGLSRIDALKGMTIWAAIANFEEEDKGSLVAGKVADFVILDKDLITCSDSEILSTHVLQTWINGALVYKK